MEGKIITAEVCGKCKFARETPQPQQPGQEMWCKRFPPHVTSILAGRGAGGQPLFMNHCTYPIVGKHEEGCGEFKPKILT